MYIIILAFVQTITPVGNQSKPLVVNNRVADTVEMSASPLGLSGMSLDNNRFACPISNSPAHYSYYSLCCPLALP